MQVTKCDRCGALYEPTKPKYSVKDRIGNSDMFHPVPIAFPNCSRLCLTSQNKDYDLCEKCTNEILKSFKGE